MIRTLDLGHPYQKMHTIRLRYANKVVSITSDNRFTRVREWSLLCLFLLLCWSFRCVLFYLAYPYHATQIGYGWLIEIFVYICLASTLYKAENFELTPFSPPPPSPPRYR